MFHVDGAPPQSENFASPQAIVGSNFYAQFQRVTRHCVEQGKHLFLAVEATVEHILLGTVYLVGRILEQDILLNRCLKCLSDDCVIMNDRVCRAVVRQNALVEFLNVLWGHFPQLESQRREVWPRVTSHSCRVQPDASVPVFIFEMMSERKLSAFPDLRSFF